MGENAGSVTQGVISTLSLRGCQSVKEEVTLNLIKPMQPLTGNSGGALVMREVVALQRKSSRADVEGMGFAYLLVTKPIINQLIGKDM